MILVLNHLRRFLFNVPNYMPKLPVIRPKNLIKALEKIGFYKVRQGGSHVFVASLMSGEINYFVVIVGFILSLSSWSVYLFTRKY